MLITFQEHKSLHLLPIDNGVFAAQQTRIPLLAKDIEPMIKRRVPVILPVGDNQLPQALLKASTTKEPLADYTPTLWHNFPFSLATAVVGVNAQGEPIQTNVLWAEKEATHWSSSAGHRLFELSGEPSEFLRRTLKQLHEQQAAIEETHALLNLLKEHGILAKAYLHDLVESRPVYRVLVDKLASLGASDDYLVMRAYHLATLIADSQKDRLELHDEPAIDTFKPRWMRTYSN